MGDRVHIDGGSPTERQIAGSVKHDFVSLPVFLWYTVPGYRKRTAVPRGVNDPAQKGIRSDLKKKYRVSVTWKGAVYICWS